MKCPSCGALINNRSDCCRSCGQQFDENSARRVALVFDIRQQVRYLESLKSYFSTSIETVSEKLEKLEQQLDLSIRDDHGKRDGESMPDPIQPLTPDADEATAVTEFFDEAKADTQVFPHEQPRKEHAVPEPSAMPKDQSGRISTLESEVRFGQRWILVIGIVTMVFAVGYFLKYSFARGWIGPIGRTAMAYAWGLSLLGVGEYTQRRSYRMFGLYLVGGGIAVLYFATWAGFQMYGLIPQTMAFLIMIVITAFAGIFAHTYTAKWLAVLGLAGGFFTPLLLSSGTANQIALMTYMVILNAGILWLASRHRWFLLESLGFVATWLLFSGWYSGHYTSAFFTPTTIYLNLFFLIYAVVPVAPAIFRGESLSPGRLWYMAPNALIAIAYAIAIIEPRFGLEAVAIVTVSYSGVFLFLAHRLSRIDHIGQSFWYLVGNAIFFLLITVPLLFTGNWLTIFWTLEGGLLIFFGRKLNRRWIFITGAVLMIAMAVRYLFHDYPVLFHLKTVPLMFRTGFFPMFVERLLTGTVVIGSLYAVQRRNPDIPMLHTGGAVGVGSLLFVVLTIETAGWFHDYLPEAQFASVSVLWTLFAATLMVNGFRYGRASLRMVSLGIFMLTVVKVFLLDISRFSTPFRIISFMALGLILIAVSWLYYRFRDQLLARDRSDGNNR